MYSVFPPLDAKTTAPTIHGMLHVGRSMNLNFSFYEFQGALALFTNTNCSALFSHAFMLSVNFEYSTLGDHGKVI